MAVFVLVFEHLLPLLIVRHDPERVLITLLPSFNLIARSLQPITRSLVGIIVTLRRERAVARARTPRRPEDDENGDAAHAYLEAGEQEGLIEREERAPDRVDRRLRRHARPRGDDAAARHRRDPVDATLGEVRALFVEQQYSRVPVFRESARSHRRVRLREGPDSAGRSPPTSAWCRNCCGRPTTCPRPSGSPSC